MKLEASKRLATSSLTAKGNKIFVAKIEYLAGSLVGEKDTVIVGAPDKKEARKEMARNFKERNTKYKVLSLKQVTDEEASKIWGAIEWY